MTEEYHKKIIIAKKLISDHFYTNQIRSSCLAQSYILYKFMMKLGLRTGGMSPFAVRPSVSGALPELIKGYIIAPMFKTYYGHFWVELDGVVHDVASDTYLRDFKGTPNLDDMLKLTRVISKEVPKEVKDEYNCADDSVIDGFEEKRDRCYKLCLEGRFLEDLKKNVSPSVFCKIKEIHDYLC